MNVLMPRFLQQALPGFPGLFYKENLRYLRVSIQTIFGPVLASLLFLFVFSHVLEGRAQAFEGVGYTSFLVPGLAAMTMLQQSFANSSSSLIVSKMMGNIVMILVAPISPLSFYLAYMLSSLLRGLFVAVLVLACGALISDLPLKEPVWAFVFLIVGGVFTSSIGVIAGIWAEKFDQIALLQVIILLPLTFLAGVFYSLESLPPLWQFLSRLNPFTYYIDGFRYGFVGSADNNIWISLLLTVSFATFTSFVGYRMIKTGYKLRS